MKNSIALIAALILLLSVSIAAAGALDGGVLHKSILSKYQTIDKFYYQPTLAGGVTYSPMVHISIPVGEWEKLSAEQKTSLKAYASLATSFARKSPLKYSGIDPYSSIASKIKYNARYITDDSWTIIEGALTNNGRDILTDHYVAQGE